MTQVREAARISPSGNEDAAGEMGPAGHEAVGGNPPKMAGQEGTFARKVVSIGGRVWPRTPDEGRR